MSLPKIQKGEAEHSPSDQFVEPKPDMVMAGCDKLEKSLRECMKRMGSVPGRDRACGHLNRALAQCLVSTACPEESEAVRSLCSSSGTALKRSQCQEAQLSLAVCLSSLQR